MDSVNLSSCKENYQEVKEKGTQKISVCDQILNMKPDSFTLNMEPFSHLTNKDLTFSSRINLQRSVSRKGSHTGAEKKMNSNCLMNDVDKDDIASPKASLVASSMPEKLMLVNQSTDHINSPQVHHQITIMAGGTATTTTAAINLAGTPTQSNLLGKRSGNTFNKSSIINPKRILFFFATLSTIGTILLICLTLSMAEYNENDSWQSTNLK